MVAFPAWTRGWRVNTTRRLNRAHPLNAGLRGWWLALPGEPRGAVVRDLVNHNHGSLVGMDVTTDLVGPRGGVGLYGAWDLDGTDAYIEVPHHASLDTGSALTIVCRFKLDSASDAGFLVDKMVNLFNDGFTLQHASSQLFYYENSSGGAIGGGTLTTGWHVAAVTSDGTTKRVWLDGVQVASGSAADVNSSASLKFGAHIGSFQNFTDGLIADVRLYERALHERALLALIREMLAGHPSTLNWISFFDLKAPSSLTTGDTTWGHDTGVTETNVLDFAAHWSGTGTIEGAGDGEQLVLESGESMTSNVVQRSGTVQIGLNQYGTPNNPDGDPLVEYRTGASEAACLAASWTTYTGPFASSGYVQVRVTSTL